ncbi:LOW QUALITY PROTEIN: golgin subfamily A member 4-like [Xyrauchen texanus]|uniref:LOW QUALITY PROTEIN: golgin subfamily A member 4-like n=1 Tax=Xyrauchen texanus TaxID=154827 RepID=UPI00224231E9|nr:LOW QUALITY PROTEIN: golgin subfamily A member 4-like [Xyrauchen texanus]
MFKKLKQKVIEEQSPQRSSAHAQVSSEERRSHPTFLQQDAPSTPIDRVLLAGMIAEPAFLSEYTIFALDHSKRPKAAQVPSSIAKATGSSPRGSVHGDGIALPQREESLSLAQKLQQKVSSVETLLRGSGRGEGLFRSGSRDSLVRSSSRESLTLVGENEALSTQTYDPPSDIESEAEESPGSFEGLSKEQLLNRLHRVERSLGNYRGKYSELVTTYRTVQRDKEKTQAILSQSQDKALRRIGELREELQMDQQAKKHLQEEFDAALEEKDQMITVLQTQVSLLKKRLQVFGGVVSSEVKTSQPTDAVDVTSDFQTPSKDDSATVNTEGSAEPGTVVDVEVLQGRIKRQESLLQRCKEMIHSSKERAAQLASENDVLQQQLQERLQELEKIKELHTSEKTKLITQLGDAKNLIEQLEQDKGMVIAETKRQMHETLEMKEEEITQLRSRLLQTLAQKDELQELKEKSEKAAFEELERALGVAQRAEEARRQLQMNMEEQVKQVEMASEEERKNLQQELTRVKQEVVTIMKRSSEDKMAEMERLHAEAMANKEEELSAQIKHAVERCREELLQFAQEREQQASLALEEAELQKAAIQTEGENKAKELHFELESARTRIQELESCLGNSEKNGAKSDNLSAQVKLAALEERHQQELERATTEQITVLNQQHNIAMEELVQKHKAEIESILKDKEEQFHTHVEEMNQKMLDKLCNKQTELETVSSKFSEVLKSKQQLGEKLSSMETTSESARQEFEGRLKEEHAKYQAEIEAVTRQHEESFAGVEKMLKEELNQLKIVLEEKERVLDEHVLREKTLEEEAKQALQDGSVQLEELKERLKKEQAKHQADIEAVKLQNEQSIAGVEKMLKEELNQLKMVLKEKEKALEEHTLREKTLEEEAKQALQDGNAQLDELKLRSQSNKEALDESRAQISSLTEELQQTRNQVKDLEHALEAIHNDCQKKEVCLQQKTNELQELEQKLQQVKKDLTEKENLHAETCKALQEEQIWLRKQLDDQKSSHEKKLENMKKDMDCKLKSQENKMEKFNQKAKEVQEKMKKKLHDQEENAKAELSKKVQELQQKDQQLKEKIFEMAHTNSEGLSSAISDLEANHKEQVEKLHVTHEQKQENLVHHWQEKLRQHEEDMQEKHALSLQEKAQEFEEISQQLSASREEREQVLKDLQDLREELDMRETTVQKLQTELREAASKLESLSEGEGILKRQVETMEKNLNQALNERNLFQDELRKAEKTSKERLQSLSEELINTQKKLSALETSQFKEGEDLQRTLAEKTVELQTKEKEFQTQMCYIMKECERCCQEAQAKLEGFSVELCKKVDGRFGELQHRVIHHQKKVKYLGNVILTKDNRINTLEKELQQKSEENQNLKSSLDEITLQFDASSKNLKALNVERESLQTDAENRFQVLSEKDLHIEQLHEKNKSISEDLKANILQMSNLESIINDLQTQLASSITEKEEAISLLNQQNNEEKETLKCQMGQMVERLEKDKTSLQEQAESLRNKFSELKKKFSQSHSTIKSLQKQIADMERQIMEKDERVQMLTASIDNQSISKSEMDQALSEKEQKVHTLTSELESYSMKVIELEEQLKQQIKEQEKLAADLQQHLIIRENDKIEIMKQLQEAQDQSSQKDAIMQKTQESLQSLKGEIQTAKQELETQQANFEKEKAEILRLKEEALKVAQEKASSETASKVAELKKKAEQKIGMIRKQLTSQIEEKEQTIKDLQTQLEGIKQTQTEKEEHIKTLEENDKTTEDNIAKLQEEHTKHLEELHQKESAERQTCLQSLKDIYEEKLAVLQKDKSAKENQCAIAAREKEEILLRLGEFEQKLSESNEQISNYQTEISCLKADLLKQTTLVQELQQTCLDLQDQIKEKQIEEAEIEHVSEAQTTRSLLGLEPATLLAKEDIDTVRDQDDWRSQKDLLVKEYEEKLKDLHRRLEEKENQIRAQQNSPQGNGETDSECLNNNTNTSEHELQKKLVEAENEKQKLHKDYTRLQKDLRSLRKQHEKELEFLKKEVAEESEQKLMLEMEDMEIKHNSSLKQLMREFNTQMALKEKELEGSVKETIEKAQTVEAELIGCHREEVSQFQKIIAQKDEDLNRTVQRYEQVLQSREEEMGGRVWEVQKELEELQQRSLSDPQGLDELKVQLAEKTTLLSEARLKEQKYHDRIYALEDKIRRSHKNAVVTHLGSTYRDTSHNSADSFSEPTEFEYLRKVIFEYMMGRETKTMAKVITSMLKFPPDQAQKVLEHEDSHVMPWLR